MERLELGTISLGKLGPEGALELLTKLARNERTADPAPAAVIFLGPWNRLDAHLGKRPAGAEGPQFHDVVFYPPFLGGQEMPDAVQRVTEYEDGTVHKVHSPADLARALRKIAVRLQSQTGQGGSR